MKLSPSILTADWSRLGEEIRAAEEAGVDYIHLDIMDGRFVPNISFGPLVVETVRRITSLPLDVHLMIVEPDQFVEEFAAAGASIITVQQEACIHLHRQIEQILEFGCKASVALNPATPIIVLQDVLTLLDQVLVMTVNPGFGGQSFIPEMVDKIRRMRAMLDAAGAHADLEIDGGIKPDNIAHLKAAGATVAVVGSAVFSREHSVQDAVSALRRAAG
jgi:ribulose-phosphate 3-epimerase